MPSNDALNGHNDRRTRGIASRQATTVAPSLGAQVTVESRFDDAATFEFLVASGGTFFGGPDLLLDRVLDQAEAYPFMTPIFGEGVVFDADPGLDSLIDIVPFGISDHPPERTGPGIRGVIPGIGADDAVILWGGGVYNWFDPLTLLRDDNVLAQRAGRQRLGHPDVPQHDRREHQVRKFVDQSELDGQIDDAATHEMLATLRTASAGEAVRDLRLVLAQHVDADD